MPETTVAGWICLPFAVPVGDATNGGRDTIPPISSPTAIFPSNRHVPLREQRTTVPQEALEPIDDRPERASLEETPALDASGDLSEALLGIPVGGVYVYTTADR